MGQIFSFCNQKGGVGKTTTVVNIASILGESGYKSLIIDLDPQGNATSGVGIDKPSLESTSYQLLVENIDPNNLIKVTDYSNLFLIPSNADLSGVELELFGQEMREFRLKKRLENIRQQFDFIFLDCPPSLGLLSINALVASNYILIPLQCEYYALEGLGQLINTFQLVKQNLNPEIEIAGVLLTMADFRTNLTQQVIEEVKSYFKEKVFEAIIPRSVKMSEAPSFGKPAVFYDPHNKASKGYREAAKEFISRFASEKKRPEGAPVENQQTETPSDPIAKSTDSTQESVADTPPDGANQPI